MIDLGDDEKGITIFSDKSKCYSVPMINYQENDDNCFLRVSHSLAEKDDTSMTWWKGRKEISFSLLGRKGDKIKDSENMSNNLFLGLLYTSKKDYIRILN